ncbi:ABC transporter substrate-binding protein [Microbacterium sp. 5K110]|uniref:ABC transporter substrate-binding protein n=1 Tax=unclassified Microbacterium TaxID=2609290 RepID=UPI001484E107|nr:ABC transporter substrate-binding protein [Microbacterium sp. 5K110]
MRRTLLSALAVVMTGALLAGCSGSTATGSAEGATDELGIAVIGPLTTYDPILSDSGVAPWMLQPVYDQLIRYTVDGGFEPNLATSWERPSDLEFVMTLREGVTFSDGTPFNAEAVKENLDRVATAAGPDASLFSKVASVTVVDDSTVSLALSSPDPSLELTLSKNLGMMASPAAIDGGTLATAPVGTGPYTLDAADSLTGDHWTFVRNPDYWGGADAFPYDELRFKKYADANAVLNAVRAGEVQIAYGAADTADAAKSAGLNVITAETNTVGIVLSDRDGTMLPALGDVRVRQALNFAIDREAILNTVALGYGTVTDQWFGPQTAGYDEALEGTYTYDPDRARKLLAEAGYPNGFEMAITIPPIHTALIQAIQGYFAQVGVTVTINDSQANFFPDVQKGVTPAYTLQNAQLDLFSLAPNILFPGGLQNPFKSESTEISDLYAQIATATPEDAAEKWQKINGILTEEAWFVPIYNGYTIAYADPRVNVEIWPGMSTPWIYSFAPTS